MSDSKMTRRDFFRTSAWATALFAAAPFWAGDLDEAMPMGYMTPSFAGASIPWSTPTDLAATDLAVLALHRLAFGPRAGQVEQVRAMGVEAFIEQQLAPGLIADPLVDELLKAFPALHMSLADLTKFYEAPFMGMAEPPQMGNTDEQASGFMGSFDNEPLAPSNGMATTASGSSGVSRSQSVLELVQATILRQVFSERQFFEVLVDFWSDHFSVYALKTSCRTLKVWDDREVIRKHALGKFRDLLFASAASPAMLVYLDNVSNVRGVPQENFAREMLELHTLGVDGGYSQKDVSETARAFTGWSVVTPRKAVNDQDYESAGAFLFREDLHDQGSKTFMGMNIPAGGGQRDAAQILDKIARDPKTAEHIAFKLVRKFVDDEPPRQLVKRAAKTFRKTDGEILEVLKTILYSEEFKASFGRKIKRPLEFINSSLRAVEAIPTGVSLEKVPLRTYRNVGKKKLDADEPIARTLRTLGHVPFLWPSPNGYPDVAAAWVNSNNLLSRWNFALALTTNRIAEFDVALEEYSYFETPAALVDLWSGRILNRALPEADRERLIAFVDGSPAETRVENLVAVLLASPHFSIGDPLTPLPLSHRERGGYYSGMRRWQSQRRIPNPRSDLLYPVVQYAMGCWHKMVC